MWTGCASEVKKDIPQAVMPVMIGTLAAGRGIGCLTSGLVSDRLLSLQGWHGEGAYGTKYAGLIIFTGIAMLLGRFGLFGRCGLRARKNYEGVEGQPEEYERLV